MPSSPKFELGIRKGIILSANLYFQNWKSHPNLSESRLTEPYRPNRRYLILLIFKKLGYRGDLIRTIYMVAIFLYVYNVSSAFHARRISNG